MIKRLRGELFDPTESETHGITIQRLEFDGERGHVVRRVLGSGDPVCSFVSYSHLDKEWFRKLQPLLKFSDRTTTVKMWHDQELKSGDRWDDEIRADLEQMDVFLCLVSNHFLASDYIEAVEMRVARRREREKKTFIVPLLICDMDDRDIRHLKPFNPLPAWGRSWRSYESNGGNTMDAHKPIRTGLLDVVEKVKKARHAATFRAP